MPPHRMSNPMAPYGIGLLIAGCVLLNGSGARAQMSGAFMDAFAPKLQAPRSAPRFQKYDRDALAKLAETTTFSPAGSGAGTTGFDSTNTRKSRSKIKTRSAADARAIAPGIPGAPTPSPYDKSADVTASVPAGMPGAPPVQLGPIRAPLKKRKAHTEPEDPYAPLGIRAGAFDLFPAVDLIGGYNTDPGQVPNGKAAWFYTIAPSCVRSRTGRATN